MKISGGFVPKQGQEAFSPYYDKDNECFKIEYNVMHSMSPFPLKHDGQGEQFIDENEKDLKTFFHQNS
jgi:hypothetical protein